MGYQVDKNQLNLYVSQLSKETQHEVEEDVKATLINLGYKGSDLEDSIQAALESRLCNLADVINVDKYVIRKAIDYKNMLITYFEKKIGETITKNIVTGKTFFTDVSERVYCIEVIGIVRDRMFVQVNSYDKAPSGFREGGKDKDFGEISINLKMYQSKESVISGIIKKVDADFLEQYKITI